MAVVLCFKMRKNTIIFRVNNTKNVNALCGVDRVLPGKPNEKYGKTYETTRPDGPLESFEAAYLLHR